ncbi:hypothetical protein [Pseudomonas sp. DP-17]|uniref:hypothetical protein n=1 Tax=Pseudomonas sp. DP-17 TaxID=1580486 RepID=UPI001EFB6366|nr:hypothetical protein [Pseudomonas sp. DP-17]MCG8911276.1 hypothetical protein [Pseudomonas sp. DP-17]
MSENDKPPSKRMTLHSVSTDDFIRFLQAHTPERDDCPVCGNPDWMILNDGDTERLYRLGTVIRNNETPLYASSFGYSCMKCGYLRQHLSKIVHRWVADNPPVEEDLAQDSRPSIDEDFVDE